jgi:hypothetical protein
MQVLPGKLPVTNPVLNNLARFSSSQIRGNRLLKKQGGVLPLAARTERA